MARVFFEISLQPLFASLWLVIDQKPLLEIFAKKRIPFGGDGDGEDDLAIFLFQGTLRILIKKPQAVHFIAEKFDAHRMDFIDRKYIHNVPAHRKMAAPLDLTGAFIARRDQLFQKGLPLDFLSHLDGKRMLLQGAAGYDFLRRFH